MEIKPISWYRTWYDLIIPPNLLMKMKLLTFFLLVTLSQVWGTGYSQKITLEKKNITLESALRAIEKQTDYLFLYDKMEVPVNHRVSVGISNKSIEETLTQLFAGLPLSYKIFHRNIVIRREQAAVAPVSSSVAPKDQSAGREKEVVQTVTGKVTDENGEGLPGVNILIKGTQKGVISSNDGGFSIDVPDDKAILVFSFVGYLSREVEIGNRTSLEITMEVDKKGLEEVIVVGYGTRKKSDLTGSVVRANIDAFRESPNVNIAQSLQGTVPGLNIGQVNAAGQNPSVSIRGRTTINGNQDVLLVVDGIIYTGSMSDLNPTDIESIDVLKDPSSMAIYGAQAANGVILITTKGGAKAAKPIFNYTGTYTTQNPVKSLHLLDREGYISKLYDQDWKNAFLAPGYTTPNPDYNIGGFISDPAIREGLENGTDYNWWDNTTNPGYITGHNLSVTGSGGDWSYFVSGGYTDQKGFIMNDKFRRITGRINLENRISRWMKVGVQSFASFSDYSGVSPNLQGITIMPPLVRPTDDEGNYTLNPTGTNIANPFLVSIADDFDKRNNLFGNIYAHIDIPFLSGLSYRLNFGNNYSWDKLFNSNPYSNGNSGGAQKTNSSSYDWTFDNILNYKKTFGKAHNVDLTVVAGRRERNFEQTDATGANFNSLRLGYNDLSQATIQRISSTAWDESYLYQMARVNYEFQYKYLFTATLRRDGFSGFAENKKIALFPSIGFGWILSEETFLRSPVINHLKFRGSYGTNGNLVGRYSSLSRMNIYPAYVFGDGGTTEFGQQVLNLANNNLSWETTTGFNFGLDFSLLRNRLSGSIDYYRTTTNDLIFNVNIPEVTGFNQITSNVGNIANRGLELVLSGKAITGKDFGWNVDFNIASNRNRIVSLLGLDNDKDGVEDDLVASGLFIGQPIGAIFDYESSGIIQLGEEAPAGFFVGTHRIVDNNGDGKIDANDRVIRGRTEPACNFGILNEFSFRNFTLRVFVNSVQGGKRGYRGLNMAPQLGIGDNIRRNNFWREFDYWTPSNPGARYRGLDQGAAIEYNYYGDRSFVRLQDITLSYRLGQDWVKKIGMEGVKLFVSGKNLATWTRWQGWDPETGDGFAVNGRPVMRGVSVGLDVRF